MDKNALYKMITYIYDELVDDVNLNPEEMREERDIYDTVLDFIVKVFGLDYDDADFVYASFVESLEGCNNDINLLTVNKIIVPKLTKFKAIKSYAAQVIIEDSYDMDTYLPVMMRHAIEEYNIDYTTTTITDWTDTWDQEIDIDEE